MDFTSDPVVKAYLFYGTIVLGKTMTMTALTIAARLRKRVFLNEEDTKMKTDGKVKFDDQDVERVRRCHLNDLENVYLFVLLGAFYCATRPGYSTALWHFRIFTVSRILHTIVYLNKVPQPCRLLSFAVGAGVCVSMLFRILATVW